MKKILTVTAILASFTILLQSCGGGAKDEKGNLTDMKRELDKLKKEKTTLETSIRSLEDKIKKADPNAIVVQKLVNVDTLRVQDFSHYIELQGKITTDQMGYVAPTGQGGLVKAIFVKAGQKVGKGQLLVKLDDAIARQQLASAQQQTGTLKAQLTLAQTTYERLNNLWKQNIGAEIEVLRAKAALETTAAQLRAAQAQVGLAQEQVNMSNVYAGLSGTIDQVNVRVGEFFTGTSPDRKPQILIVGSTGLKVEVNVPDNYVARVKKGDKVKVEVAETGRPAFESAISAVGAAIDPTTRSFTTEAKLPSDPLLKPNQTAIMKILDYEAKGAVAVPVNVVQSDEKNKYVYVIEKAGDKMVARKKIVITGETYGGFTEIKSGLSGGDLIITEGYQTVYDGQSVTTGK